MRKVLFLFGQLGDEDVAWLRRHGTVQTLAPGDTLIDEGQRVDAVFIVLYGSFAISTVRSGKVAEVGAGEVLGEMSFVDSRPASATARATTTGAVLRIDRARLSCGLAGQPLFAARFYRALALFLSDRLRATEAGVDVGAAGALDPQVLEQITQAGARFDAMVRQLIQTP